MMEPTGTIGHWEAAPSRLYLLIFRLLTRPTIQTEHFSCELLFCPWCSIGNDGSMTGSTFMKCRCDRVMKIPQSIPSFSTQHQQVWAYSRYSSTVFKLRTTQPRCAGARCAPPKHVTIDRTDSRHLVGGHVSAIED